MVFFFTVLTEGFNGAAGSMTLVILEEKQTLLCVQLLLSSRERRHSAPCVIYTCSLATAGIAIQKKQKLELLLAQWRSSVAAAAEAAEFLQGAGLFW